MKTTKTVDDLDAQRFIDFTRKLMAVPKEEIDEQQEDIRARETAWTKERAYHC